MDRSGESVAVCRQGLDRSKQVWTDLNRSREGVDSVWIGSGQVWTGSQAHSYMLYFIGLNTAYVCTVHQRSKAQSHRVRGGFKSRLTAVDLQCDPPQWTQVQALSS